MIVLLWIVAAVACVYIGASIIRSIRQKPYAFEEDKEPEFFDKSWTL